MPIGSLRFAFRPSYRTAWRRKTAGGWPLAAVGGRQASATSKAVTLPLVPVVPVAQRLTHLSPFGYALA